MNRREALKSTAFLIGSATTFTSLGVLTQGCSPKHKNDWTTFLNEYVQQLLAEVAGTILPATETPGAKELEVHLYIIKMIQDCEKAEVAPKFLAGMKLLEDHSNELYGEDFADCLPEQKLEALNAIAELPDTLENEDPEKVVDYTPLKLFMKKAKGYTIRGYLNSEYYLTEIKPYELVPGRFDGCMPVEDLPYV